MPAELSPRDYVPRTAHEVDVDELVVRRVTLESVTKNGVVQEGYLDTKIRSADNIRYLYLHVAGCSYDDVVRYISTYRRKLVTEENIETMMPYESMIFDLIPFVAQPRIEIDK